MKNNSSAKLLVPKLRFNEFNEKWEEKKLSLLTEKISDGIHTTPKYDDDGNYFFVNGNNITNGKLEINENTKKVNKEEFEKHKKDIGEETILLSINGTIGNLAFYNLEPVVLGKSAAFINISKNCSKEFIYNQLKTHRILKYYFSELTGSTIKNLSIKTIKNSPIALPKYNEQQKIATFLSSVDNWIENLEKEKESLEEYKKGMMQKIFSQEIRFKDGDENEYPEWKKYKFTDLYKFGVTNSFSRDKLNNLNIGIFNIHYGDIHTKFSSHFELTKEDVPTIESSIDVLGKLDKVSVGDIVIADASEDYKDIGKTIEIISTNGEEVVAGLHTILGKNKKTFKTIGFISYLMQSYKHRLKLMKIAQGAKVLGLSKKYLKDVVFEMPCDEEQQKIASFLFSIDMLIESKTDQIQKAKEWKKGLLQQMFV